MIKPRKKITSCQDTKGGCFKQVLEEEPKDQLIDVNLLTFEQRTGLRENPIGLGDRVERIAQPIARVIDGLAGTNIQDCGGCKKRKEWLNKNFPNT
jgi:phosphopentomutase